MAMLWPYEWWRDGMPQQTIHDAKGRRLRHVVACNPATGEVIDLLPLESRIGPLLFALERLAELLWLKLWIHGLHSSRSSELARGHYFTPAPLTQSHRHYFAPAPLTITRAEP